MYIVYSILVYITNMVEQVLLNAPVRNKESSQQGKLFPLFHVTEKQMRRNLSMSSVV